MSKKEQKRRENKKITFMCIALCCSDLIFFFSILSIIFLYSIQTSHFVGKRIPLERHEIFDCADCLDERRRRKSGGGRRKGRRRRTGSSKAIHKTRVKSLREFLMLLELTGKQECQSGRVRRNMGSEEYMTNREKLNGVGMHFCLNSPFSVLSLR